MRIAIGCDHRGGKVAYRLVRDVFLRDHHADLEYDAQSSDVDRIVGAFYIADSGDGMRVRPIEYGQPLDKYEASDSVDAFAADETNECVDYPDVAAAVAELVSEGKADRGVLICGTGIGMCITANKFYGVRAAVCFNEVAAELSRRHNDANVLCVSGEFLSISAIESLVRIWMETGYDGGRHEPRVQKICEIEKQTGL